MAADTNYVDIEDYETALAGSWGRRILDRRTELGLTQVQLAERIGISQRFLSHIECGDTLPREGLKQAFAYHLRVKRVGDLFPSPRTVAPVRVRREEGAA